MGVWVSVPGIYVGVNSGKLGMGRTLVPGAVKGCSGMVGLEAWAPRPTQGCGCPLQANEAPSFPSCACLLWASSGEGGGKGNLSVSGMGFEYLEPSTIKILERTFSDKSETNKTKAIIC